jgi:3-methyladenine DNA glycosylase AlkD
VAEATAGSVVAWLERSGRKSVREGMARYAIPSDKAFGVSVGDLKRYAKTIGTRHALANELWKTGWYEARMLAAFVDEPARVTVAQMDRWCREFDNWAVCDHICFILFDKTPHAMGRVHAWATRKPEIEKRAAFALLASVALHDRQSPDAPFARTLPLIARAATDERNFVKKGVLWALRGVGGRSPALHAKAVALASTLAESPSESARWIGREARRELTGAPAMKRLGAQRRRAVSA